jgi:hypothetical protein
MVRWNEIARLYKSQVRSLVFLSLKYQYLLDQRCHRLYKKFYC